MANILHSQLTGSDLHETKGASSASVGQVPIANGSGGAPFGQLSYTQIGNTPIPKLQLNGVASTGQAIIKTYTTTSTTGGAWSVSVAGFTTIWAVSATAIDNVEALGVVATVKVASTSSVSGITVTQAAAANTAKVGVPVQVIVIGV
ncbi:hypothetical protein [Citrobacter phage CVT22]|uniref:Uncharacterized protein n=1 Tax=Citrobacter phage CVT22 TaxID=1622234 RepID=A0A0R6BA31_9CAUD|nr:hypothetical protein APL39_gp23 [Citrobacter phage CVT22]AJT60727.1 hypothetical protein [Citrobacter phage CVT22]